MPGKRVRPEEHSSDVDPPPGESFTSALLDDLNLQVDDASRVISVLGNALMQQYQWVGRWAHKDLNLGPAD